MSFECLAFCTNQLPTGRPPYTADLSQLPGSKTRFLSHYIDAPNAALFPFGFGLSYTTFSSGRDALAQHHRSKGSDSNRHITSGGNTTAMNTGKLAATEVVQCYIGNREASLEQPVRSLQGIARVALAPGESHLFSTYRSPSRPIRLARCSPSMPRPPWRAMKPDRRNSQNWPRCSKLFGNTNRLRLHDLPRPVPQDRIAQDGASVCLPSRRCTMEDWRRSVHTIFTPLREFHGVFSSTLEGGQFT